MGHERLHGNRDRFRTIDEFAFAAAVLLGDSERRLEECRNAVRRLELTAKARPFAFCRSGLRTTLSVKRGLG
jgi:hypothetical protein